MYEKLHKKVENDKVVKGKIISWSMFHILVLNYFHEWLSEVCQYFVNIHFFHSVRMYCRTTTGDVNGPWRQLMNSQETARPRRMGIILHIILEKTQSLLQMTKTTFKEQGNHKMENYRIILKPDHFPSLRIFLLGSLKLWA